MHFFQKHGQDFYWKSKNRVSPGENELLRYRTRAESEISPPETSLRSWTAAGFTGKHEAILTIQSVTLFI